MCFFFVWKSIMSSIFNSTVFNFNKCFYFFFVSFKNYHKSWMYTIGSIVVVGHLMLNGVYTSISLYVSHHNYPGGKAMYELHRLIPATAGKLILIAHLILNYYCNPSNLIVSYLPHRCVITH